MKKNDDMAVICEKSRETLLNLYSYIKNDQLSCVEEALKHIPELRDAPKHGLRGRGGLLHEAAEYGKSRICERLIELGIDINVTAIEEGYSTALHNAAANGHLLTMRLLLKKGAHVDADNLSITTPLMEAIISGHREACELLIDNGADINRLHTRLNISPRDLAEAWGQDEIKEILEKRGALSVKDITVGADEQVGGPIINFVHNTAGWVLPEKFAPTISTNGVQLRISCIDGKNKLKLLFTVGLFRAVPRTELFLCLPGDWPLPRLELSLDDPWAFPVHLLSRLADRTKNNAPLKESVLICRSQDAYSDLAWPDEIDALLVVNKAWNKKPDAADINEDDKVFLFVLTPVKFGKKGCPSGESLISLVQRKQTGNWGSICLPKPAGIE